MKKRENIIIGLIILSAVLCCTILFGLKNKKKEDTASERESTSIAQKTGSDGKDDITSDQLPIDMIDTEEQEEEMGFDTEQQRTENDSYDREQIKKQTEKKSETKKENKKKESIISKSDSEEKDFSEDKSITEKIKQSTTEEKKKTEDSGITIVKPEDKEKKDSIELPIDEFQ